MRTLLPEHAGMAGDAAGMGSGAVDGDSDGDDTEDAAVRSNSPAVAETLHPGLATDPAGSGATGTLSGSATSPTPLGPTVGSVAALIETPLPPAKQRQVRQLATRVEAMESQLRNVKVGELLPSVPELPEYLQRMRRLRGALDEYIGFLERVHLDAPGEMEQPA